MTYRSPLDDVHRRAGARMGDFGGWQMPIQFRGVVEEHSSVRQRVGVFDVSHLGKLLVRGPGARDFLNRRLTNDLDRIAPGQAQYTLCCNERGGIVDDLFAYVRSDDEVLLVPNAANAASVAASLAASSPARVSPGDASPDDVSIHDQHAALGIIAVQGPACDEVMAAAGLPHGHDYLSFLDVTWRDWPVTVCRTGYTGERGYEIVAPAASAESLWSALLEAGEPDGIRACGLGARDTLRTEMGYPLHGQDISEDITPVQARLGWAVGWDKPGFFGRPALLAEREAGPVRVLRGLSCLDRGIPRPGMVVLNAAEGDATAPIGHVTSGTFSPTLKRGIALALLEPGVGEGSEVLVDVRGRRSPAVVVRPPFVASHAR